jgi:ABC-type polar amino acid transport system ATPase subunit
MTAWRPAGPALLALEDVSVSFGAVDVLAGIDLQVRAGEFVALVGPSGCGKTTLLNVCSGWLAPTSGRVQVSSTLRMVFQQDGLFPWLTAGERTVRSRCWRSSALRDSRMPIPTTFRAGCGSASSWRAPSRETRRCC